MWKDKIDEGKKKRKREEDKSTTEKADEGVKRVKAGGAAAGSSAAASPAASTPGTEPKGSADPSSPAPLSTIDSSRKTPRTSKSDGVASSLRADNTDAASDDVRDKCVALIYDALASDSNASIKVLTERAVGIEAEAFKLLNYSTSNDYRASELCILQSTDNRNALAIPESQRQGQPGPA